ncbi:MAG: carboxypeptidase regulatory-like domain-containing protein, partial [Gemmatimonadetes bacterium]|nr:carboxypeptidase regulatory-like domain-containing protein [Gemmatimonadota bacterium]
MSPRSFPARPGPIVSLFLSSLLLMLPACGGGSDNPADPGNGNGDGGSTSSNASLRGYVYRTNPVHVVDDPVRAPEGSSPVSGADVSAYDIDGLRIGQETTTTDGEFWFENLPPGYARVEVTIPGSASADTAFAITGVAGVEILAGRTYEIDRAAAIGAAIAGVSEDALVLGTLQPLPAGTVVEALRDSDVVETLRTLTADEWFFLVDLDPSAAFDHRADFVYVDAATGAVVTQAADTRPHVNGRLLWGSDRRYFAYKNVDWNTVGVAEQSPGESATASAEVVRLPPETQGKSGPFSFAPRAKEAGDPEDVFTFNLTLSSETSIVINGNRMENAFEQQGVPSLNRFDLYTPDLSPNELRPAVTGVISGLNEAMQERIDEGGDPTLVFYVSGHSGFVDGAPTGNLLVDLADDRDAARDMWFFSLHNTVATRVRVILETCYAELHAKELKEHFENIPFENRPDLKVYAASEDDETANGRPYW